jgi:hypothetical protein
LLARAAALVVAALGLAGCGDDGGDSGNVPLAWKGTPVVRASQTTTARVLIGTVENHSGGDLRIRADALRVVDQNGRAIRSTRGFRSSFVRSLYPQNGRPGGRRSQFPLAEQERLGLLVMLGADEESPISVSWYEPPGSRTAARILYPGGSLRIPEARVPGSG